MKIKVCGMRDANNIMDLCALPVDYIGFIFYPKSARFAEGILTVESAKEIPSHITKTGVYVNSTIEAIEVSAIKYGCGAIQLHGNESPEFCQSIKSLGYTVIKAFGVSEELDFDILKNYHNSCDFFLFDTKSSKHGGTGKKFDWNILSQYDNSKPLFLSGGISAEDASTISSHSQLNIHCLDLNSRFETEPGLKDIAKLQAFIAEIKDLG